MNSRTFLISALTLIFCTKALSATNIVGQVVLLDQGFWGGTDLWISESGKVVCRIVNTQDNEDNRKETKYSFDLSKEQGAILSELLEKHDFFNIKTTERRGIPDEARPVIFMKHGEKMVAVAKWANDKHKDFDPIYNFLLQVATTGKQGSEVQKGIFKSEWHPEGFPENKTIRDMTQKANLAPQQHP